MTETTPPNNDPEIARAAALIRSGGLVAFPTETVYGLGANALDPEAVQRIFAAKGRPSNSPLIVHVASILLARLIVREWPREAELLANRFWPGPLTLVLKKHPNLPAAVTAGLDTVGVRVPAHPVALALLREAGVPIAAPSANRFAGLSPTRAEHVRQSLGDRVDMVLEGGPSEVGIESTVLSVAGETPLLVRPGMISREQLEALIGPVGVLDYAPGDEAHPSPGLHRRHYSPSTRVVLAHPGSTLPDGAGAFLYLTTPRQAGRAVQMPTEADAYAAVLYDTLHQLDAQGWPWIAIELPPDTPEWSAIRDRLKRAAAD